jgi:hypothetical protein
MKREKLKDKFHSRPYQLIGRLEKLALLTSSLIQLSTHQLSTIISLFSLSPSFSASQLPFFLSFLTNETNDKCAKQTPNHERRTQSGPEPQNALKICNESEDFRWNVVVRSFVPFHVVVVHATNKTIGESQYQESKTQNPIKTNQRDVSCKKWDRSLG